MPTRPRTANPLVRHPRSPRRFSPRHTRARASVGLLTVLFVVFAQGVGASVAHGSAVAARTMRLNPTGIGPVRFGLPKTRAVTSLRALFGTPTWRGENTGCGPRFTEVEWGDLVAEFRAKIFTSLRYVEGGYPLLAVGAGQVPSRTTPFPRLATAKGITLGSSLARLRQRYRKLRQSGSASWTAPGSLTFVLSSKYRNMYAGTDKLVEIKSNTCGAF